MNRTTWNDYRICIGKRMKDQCQTDQDLIGRCRLRIQCRSGKVQHNDDPGKRGHHNDNGRCQCNQCQSDQNSQCSIDLTVPIIIGNADRIGCIQRPYFLMGSRRSGRIDHCGDLCVSRKMSFRSLCLYRYANTQYAHRDQQAYHIRCNLKFITPVNDLVLHSLS